MIDATTQALLIGGNPDDAALFQHAFARARMAASLKWIPNGAPALEFIDRINRHDPSRPVRLPKVIFLDPGLPQADGLQVLRRVKADPRLWSVPVVVLTSSTEEHDLAANYQLGANSYVLKPADVGQFAHTVGLLIQYWTQMNRPPVSTGASRPPG